MKNFSKILYIIIALSFCHYQAIAGSHESPVAKWFDAVKNNDLQWLTAQVQLYGNIIINTRDQNGNTALIKAAANGNESLVNYILTVPTVRVNLQNNDGFSALTMAIFWGHETIVKILLDIPHINLDYQNIEGDTIFSLTKVYPAIEALITKKIEQLATLKQWFLSARDGNIQVLKKLSKIVDINAQNRKGETALMLAALNGHENIIRFLLNFEGEQVINVNMQDVRGNTALIAAAYAREKTIVNLLLKFDGININSQKNDGDTALMMAIAWDDGTIIDLLLNVPEIDVNIAGKHGQTPLILAIRRRLHRIVTRLLNMFGIIIHAKDHSGKTALDHANGVFADLIRAKIAQLTQIALEAIPQNNLEILKSVTSQIGIDTIRDKNKNSLMDKAITADQPEVVEFLLKNAANSQQLLAEIPFESIDPNSKLFHYYMNPKDQNGLPVPDLGSRKRPLSGKCPQCGLENCEMRCSVCKTVYYCSRKCQREHWKTHRYNCKKAII